MTIKGKVWKFGDGISTDHIAPGRLFHLRSNLPELAKHCMEDARPEFAGRVKFVKVNTDENPNLASAFGIRGIPTLAIVHGQEVLDAIVGLRPKAALARAIERAARRAEKAARTSASG